MSVIKNYDNVHINVVKPGVNNLGISTCNE